VLALCLLVIGRYLFPGAPPPSPDHPLAEGIHRVVRVVDGDTIVIAPDSFVRLIGVNTPETVRPEYPVEPFGPEASAFTRKFLAGGTARLTFDRERVDRFGRFLAFVWVGDRLLNEELLRAGLARWEPHFNYSSDMKRRFRQAQDEARRQKVGLWSRCDDHGTRRRSDRGIRGTARAIRYTDFSRWRAVRAACVENNQTTTGVPSCLK
jgi:micrococcal nuclease